MRLRPLPTGQFIALLMAVLWVMQPVLGLVHARAHAHLYCPTHHAFEEASATGSSSRTSARQSPLSIEKRTDVSPAAARHVACAFESTQRSPQLAPPEVQPVVRRCLEVSRPATAPPRASSSLSALDTAPKGSPPARV